MKHMVEYLLCKCEALSSNPSPTITTKIMNSKTKPGSCEKEVIRELCRNEKHES
jgi:hypothetical protein